MNPQYMKNKRRATKKVLVLMLVTISYLWVFLAFAQNRTEESVDILGLTPDPGKHLHQVSELEAVFGSGDPFFNNRLYSLSDKYKDAGYYTEARDLLKMSLDAQIKSEKIDGAIYFSSVRSLFEIIKDKDFKNDYDLYVVPLRDVCVKSLSDGDLSAQQSANFYIKTTMDFYKNINPYDDALKTMVDLAEFIELEVEAIEKNKGIVDSGLIFPLEKLVSIIEDIFYEYLDIEQNKKFNDVSRGFAVEEVCFTYQDQLGNSHRVCNTQNNFDPLRLETGSSTAAAVRSYLGKRTITLDKIANIYESNDSFSGRNYAQGLAYLADHYSIRTGKRSKAMKYYLKAYERLESEGDDEFLLDLFDKPKQVRTNYAMIGEGETFEKSEAQASYIRISFTVSEKGQATDLKVIEKRGEKQFTATKLAKKLLKSIRFRPRFANGEAVDTSGVVIHFSYDDLEMEI